MTPDHTGSSRGVGLPQGPAPLSEYPVMLTPERPFERGSTEVWIRVHVAPSESHAWAWLDAEMGDVERDPQVRWRGTVRSRAAGDG